MRRVRKNELGEMEKDFFLIAEGLIEEVRVYKILFL